MLRAAVCCAALVAGVGLSPGARGQEPSRPAEHDAAIARLEAQHVAAPDDLATLHRLAEALLARARISADPRDASRAEALAARALALAPGDARAWTLKAWSELNAHRFAEALAAARKAERLAPPSATNLGLAADALTELGRYADALAATQTMLDRFPGLPAYSRAAQLRFLHNDLGGAIEMMGRAVRAGRPRSEETAWALGQLAELYLHDGDTVRAEQAVQAALATYPGLPQTVAQQGRVLAAQGRFTDALAAYRRAAQAQPSPEVVFPLWQLTERLGLEAEARRHAELLNALARLDAKPGLSRRVLALFFAEQDGGLGTAERLARRDLESRPDIYSHDTLAWVLYRAGKLKEARAHAIAALKLGTPDVVHRYRAGTILVAAGETERGGRLLREAQARAPHLAPYAAASVGEPRIRAGNEQ